METVYLIAGLAWAIISIVMVVKFFQISSDLRAIRQSIPMAYRQDYEELQSLVNKAIAMGDKEYAKKILIMSRADLNRSPDANKAQIGRIDKLISDL